MSIDSTIDLRSGVVYTYDIVFGVLLVLALIEATRRSVGTSLAIVTGCFILYGFFGQYMPGFLAHVGMDLPRFISIVYLGTDGIYGTAIYASASYIVLFVILGAWYLMRRDVGDYFTKLASGHLDVCRRTGQDCGSGKRTVWLNQRQCNSECYRNRNLHHSDDEEMWI